MIDGFIMATPLAALVYQRTPEGNGGADPKAEIGLSHYFTDESPSLSSPTPKKCL